MATIAGMSDVCMICGLKRENIQLRKEIGYVGVYLCNDCYQEEKILRRD